MKSGLSGWLGRSITLSDGDFWSAFLGRATTSGKSVNVDTALTLSAVWGCVRLIAQTIATLPLQLYESMPDGSRRLAKDHPLYSVIGFQPNADMTSVEFWESVLGWMLLWGKAYVELTWNGARTRIIAMDLLPSSKVRVQCQVDGTRTYWHTQNGRERQIEADDMWVLPAMTLNGRDGLSVIFYGANSMGAALAADEASSKVFANGMRAGGALSLPSILKKDQRDEIRASLAEQLVGVSNTGKLMVLEGGMTYTPLSINPEDAQLLQTRGYSVEDVCRWFDVHPSMIGHAAQGDTSWGTGLEQRTLGFLTFTLRRWLKKIEAGVRKNLLMPAERNRFYAEFALEGLLRADSAGRASFYSQMTQNGIYTRDDCREKENLPRLGGNAAVLTVQSNLLPIDQLGKQDAASDAKDALLAWLHQEAITDERK